MQYTYDHNGTTYTVNLEPGPDDTYTVTIGGETFAVVARRFPNGGWQLMIDGQRLTAYSTSQVNARYIALNSATYTLTIPDTRSRRRTTHSGGDLSAQMPGQVREVLVRVGDAVTAGQTLVILEAMKMEIRVAAPFAGTVKALLVAPGDVVERGQRLLEMAKT